MGCPSLRDYSIVLIVEKIEMHYGNIIVVVVVVFVVYTVFKNSLEHFFILSVSVITDILIKHGLGNVPHDSQCYTIISQ